MTFLEKLQANMGGLLRLKTALWWYDEGVWDNKPGRICLILNASQGDDVRNVIDAHTDSGFIPVARYAVRLLIDESPHWIWADEKDVEFLMKE